MADKIDLSIIIPTFRREQELLTAINSALKINQLHIEILISDDSPEGGAESYVKTIADKRVIYEKRAKPTGGFPAIVRNDLVKKAKGECLYFLDDDDTIEADTIVEMYLSLRSTTHGVAIGAVKPFGDPESAVVKWEVKHYQKARSRMRSYLSQYQFVGRLLFNVPYIVCSACMVKKTCFDALNGFNTQMPLFEDIDFYMRAIRKYGFVYVDKILLNRKTGGNSLIQNEKDRVKTLESYKTMQDNYRDAYGITEFLLLKIANKIGLC